jgi:predicted acylesterase/phospholipase RssA
MKGLDAISKDKSFPRRILTIDGGGLKGAMPAAFIAEMEAISGQRVVDNFDLIAGTSTGGIIALGLAAGLTGAEILDFYLTRGPRIFDQEPGEGVLAAVIGVIRRAARSARQLGTAKYDSEILRQELGAVLGDRRIGDALTRIVVPAYDSANGGLYVFKTAHHERLAVDWRVPMVEAALATAAAPTYLPAHSFAGAAHLLDGGVWANNPMGVAALEGATVLGWDMTQARLLSLGCTSSINPARRVIGFRNVKWLIQTLFDGQDRFSHATAKLLLGHPHTNPHLIRISPQVPPGHYALDDARRMDELVRMGRSNARAAMPKINECFLLGGREPFIPCHPAAVEEK